MKFCNNPNCSTFNIKVETDKEKCLVCNKGLVNSNPFTDLFKDISEDVIGGLFGKRGRK